MACFSKYLCKHCGYEILTEPHFYYRLMSGYSITRKCSNCKSILREHFPWEEVPHFEEPEHFFNWIENNGFITKHGFCPECHQFTAQTLWSPVHNRCPKCRHALTLEQKNIMMVD